jgi:hypothetical protein
MRSWKVILGLGAACAACCAIPLLGLVGGMAAFSGFASAVWSCADEFLPAALVLGAVAAAGAGIWWVRRKLAARSSGCGCETSCATEVGHAKC